MVFFRNNDKIVNIIFDGKKWKQVQVIYAAQ